MVLRSFYGQEDLMKKSFIQLRKEAKKYLLYVGRVAVEKNIEEF